MHRDSTDSKFKMDKYDECINQWNQIFKEDDVDFIPKRQTGNEKFDRGIEWVTKSAKTVLDFGCGNGSVLFSCSYYGTQKHIGLDLSHQAIKNAAARSKKVPQGEYEFLCGGIEALKNRESQSVDAVILSNIIDNLFPEDAIAVLEQIKRILKKEGRVLVKLNDYVPAAHREQLQLKEIQENVLDDGMLLWNNTTEQWNAILKKYFVVEHMEKIYYEAYKQYNRMYFLSKNVLL